MQVIADLHHPNIVRFLDIRNEQGTYFFVMEYCDGGSLADVAKSRGGTISPDVLMPPDQITNFKYVKPVSDVWSFAASLYSLLTGRFPFPSFSISAFPLFRFYPNASPTSSTTPPSATRKPGSPMPGNSSPPSNRLPA